MASGGPTYYWKLTKVYATAAFALTMFPLIRLVSIVAPSLLDKKASWGEVEECNTDSKFNFKLSVREKYD